MGSTRKLLSVCQQMLVKKKKFHVVGLGEGRMRFKAMQIEEKLTYIRVFRGTTCFCFNLPLAKFIY